MLLFFSILFFLFDLYIFFALRATGIGFAKRRFFAYLWWGYAMGLPVAVYVSANYNIPLMYRSVILTVFFMTALCKFIFAVILLVDDLRRGSLWIARLFSSPKADGSAAGLPAGPSLDPQPAERPKEGISRSEFLTRSGLLVASLPVLPLSWGMISGGYDYRIKRQKLHLPNLPAAFHGMRIAQISDVHSGSFYNKKAVLGGVEMLLGEKPDMIFFTGDLVNNLASEMRDYQDIFAKSFPSSATTTTATTISVRRIRPPSAKTCRT